MHLALVEGRPRMGMEVVGTLDSPMYQHASKGKASKANFQRAARDSSGAPTSGSQGADNLAVPTQGRFARNWYDREGMPSLVCGDSNSFVLNF